MPFTKSPKKEPVA